MRNYLLIALGGFLGATARYLAKGIQIYNYHENVPLNTLLINISGSFLLALILTIAYEIWKFDAGIRMALTTGFLGAFTTFSTLCGETTALIRKGDYFSAISYVTVSTVLGLAAAYFGTVLAREVLSRLAGKGGEKDEKESAAEGGTE